MQRFDDPMQAPCVAAGQVFDIVLAANPTTGYMWHAYADTQFLELVGRSFELGGIAVGAGGHEIFHFRAVKAGRAEIAFEYRRPWGGEAHDIKRFQVVIE